MSDPTDPDVLETSPEMTALTTVLNKVRPTVVVRRRVYEVAREAAPSPGFVAMEDDEDGPPSSVNVARALASLRGDELKRLEDILRDSEAERETEASMLAAEPLPPDPEPDSAAAAAAVRAIPVGSTISVPELSRRLGVETKDLVTTLVAAGYFSTTAKSTLSRADATTAAWMFGFTVDPVEDADAPPKKKSGATKKKK